ncbi:MAG: CRISPR-associated helicase Cas3' [Candidatus Kapaibacterium sp.]|nr:MAG: CRISPR-associated helicase Cas3' [Candidatus Kapabacteria bacterium]
MTFSLLSHPHKLLSDHVTNVLENARTLYAQLPISDDTKRLIDICCLFHDIGKASTFFQEYIRDTDNFPTEKHKYKNHATISAIMAFGITIEQGFDEKSAFFAYLCVLRHHGALNNYQAMLPTTKIDVKIHSEINQAINYAEYATILEKCGYAHLTRLCNAEFCKKNINFLILSFEPDDVAITSDDFYTLSIMFSVLLSADKGECIFDGKVRERSVKSLATNLVDVYKKKKFGTVYQGLDATRQDVYESVARNIITHKDKHFLSINVPTGIGKTLTVLNGALQMLSKRSDLAKIIYCLPFTSVIDQNAAVFEDVLKTSGIEPTSEHLLVNHHLSELRYTTSDDELGKAELEANQAEYLITSFDAMLNVTTFYQFLHGVFTGQNRDIRKLNSFANSVVILDEVQSIPVKYWKLIRETFKQLATRLNITFILVTATMPLIFDESEGEITELVDDKPSIFAKMNRIRLDTSLLRSPMTIQQFADVLQNDIEKESTKSRLVILNTIDASKELYKLLKERGYTNLLYLSTNLPPRVRLARIRCIKRARKPYIVISTQLVEAGVDIDLDVVYRDMATLDSIFQACGRCNRNAGEGKQGLVRLLSLVNANQNNKPFASYVYDDFDVNKTREVLQMQDVFEESEFFALANRYFTLLGDERMGKSQGASDSILQAMAQLRYEDAFVPSKQNPQAFQLIEEENKLPVFVMLTDKAQKLHDEYRELIKKASEASGEEHFAIKHSIKSCQRKMAEYIVNIRPRDGEKLSENQSFFVIADYRKDFQYDPETGVNRETLSYSNV